jgi:hypothetical protein
MSYRHLRIETVHATLVYAPADEAAQEAVRQVLSVMQHAPIAPQTSRDAGHRAARSSKSQAK